MRSLKVIVLRCILGVTQFSPVLATIHESIDTLPALTYDFVLIGGGTAGNVVANRLTEDPDVHVLVLEAGGSDAGIVATPPLLAPMLAPFTPYDWNYTTTPQSGLNGRSIPYLRGFVLGGSSSINYMTYVRGSRDDYDRYANITGDAALSWANIQPYIMKNERFVAPSDGESIGGRYTPSVHSVDGVMGVSLRGYPWKQAAHIVNTTREPEFSEQFPFNEDVNAGRSLGISWAQATIANGHRQSFSDNIPRSGIHLPPEHQVLLHARATRLIQTGTSDGYPLFNAVEFTTGTSASAPRSTISARREVVLSAGSLNTPQLLMLSGIGDPAELKAVGIRAVVPNTAVGKNMSDHAILSNQWEARPGEAYETYLRDPQQLKKQLQRWSKTGEGPLSYTLVDFMGWFRVPQDEGIPDSSAGPNSAHFALMFSNGFTSLGDPMPPEGNFFSIFTALMSPTARGTLSLRSADPFDAPLVNPNLLGTPADVATMVSALRTAQRFVNSRAMSSIVVRPFGALADVYDGTDAQLAEYARERGGSVLHAVGTAAMGPFGDDTGGVVDPQFRVKGVRGLSVVDASVIPVVPSAHTQAAVYIFAERGVDVIKQRLRDAVLVEQRPPVRGHVEL